MSRPYSCPLASSRTRRRRVANLTVIAVLLAPPATAEAASPLRPPSDAHAARPPRSFNPPCQTFGTRGLNTAFFGLTTSGVIRRLVIAGEPLATAQGLRIGDSDPPRRRVIMTDQDDRVVEVSVGFRPEVDFDEGCA